MAHLQIGVIRYLFLLNIALITQHLRKVLLNECEVLRRVVLQSSQRDIRSAFIVVRIMTLSIHFILQIVKIKIKYIKIKNI